MRRPPPRPNIPTRTIYPTNFDIPESSEQYHERRIQALQSARRPQTPPRDETTQDAQVAEATPVAEATQAAQVAEGNEGDEATQAARSEINKRVRAQYEENFRQLEANLMAQPSQDPHPAQPSQAPHPAQDDQAIESALNAQDRAPGAERFYKSRRIDSPPPSPDR